MRTALFLILLLASCSQAGDSKTEMTLADEAKLYFAYNELVSVQVVPSEQPGLEDISVEYPIQNFDPAVDMVNIRNNFASTLETFFAKERPVHKVTVRMSDKKRERPVGVFEITQAELKEIKSNTPYIHSLMQNYIEYEPAFLLELSLLGYANTAKNIEIARDGTGVEISFELEKSGQAYTKTPLEDIGLLEALVAGVVNRTFSIDTSAQSVSIRAYAQNRSMVAGFGMERGEFEAILEKWDDLRYKIYDRINYTPDYLIDYVSHSEPVSVDFGMETSADLYYRDDFVDIDRSVNAIETDADAIIDRVFSSYPEVMELSLAFRAKLPAEPGDITSDGVHKIVSDAYRMRAERRIWEALDLDKLTAQQHLFNYESAWDHDFMELKLRRNLFGSPDFLREVVITGAALDLEIDSCVLTNDLMIGPRVKAVLNAIAEGSEADLESEVFQIMKEYARKAVFEIHPPYLEELTLDLKMVYRDTTGQEIDVVDLGEIVFEKEEDAMYWFQIRDPKELEWVIETDESLDIDNDEVLCQA